MPAIQPDGGFAALQQQIKAAFDNSIKLSGAPPGPKTEAINAALAAEIATAISTFVKAAIVNVNVVAASPSGPVSGIGTG